MLESSRRNSSSIMDGYGPASATDFETMAGRPRVMATKLYSIRVFKGLRLMRDSSRLTGPSICNHAKSFGTAPVLVDLCPAKRAQQDAAPIPEQS